MAAHSEAAFLLLRPRARKVHNQTSGCATHLLTTARSLDAGGFLSLPYLCLDQFLHATTPRSSTLHLPKTLLQHHFRFDEYASDEDESFLFAESGKHILGPPMRALTVLTDELWGLCLDERKSTPILAVSNFIRTPSASIAS